MSCKIALNVSLNGFKNSLANNFNNLPVRFTGTFVAQKILPVKFTFYGKDFLWQRQHGRTCNFFETEIANN